MTQDLVIRRNDPSDPIDRQVWLSYAVDTVALVQLAPGKEGSGIEFPAFGLYRHYDHPVLFWRGGEVLVREAHDDHTADLRLIADQLRAELVPVEGRPEV